MIQIYNGMTDKDQFIGTFCGSNKPPVFTSTSNFLYVHFYTDHATAFAGFTATYTQLPGKITFFYSYSTEKLLY
jgi:cubilin